VRSWGGIIGEMTRWREAEKTKRQEPLTVPALLLLRRYFCISGGTQPGRPDA